MADIALVAAATLHIVESLDQSTHIALAAVVAGDAMLFDANGKLIPTAAGAASYGVASHSAQAGFPVTVIRKGVIDGYDVSALAYGAPIYLSATAGKLATTGTVQVGQVIPAHGQLTGVAADKLVKIEMRDTEASLSGAGSEALTIDLMAASVDKWLFVADRAYRVTAVREIHSVVGGSGAVVRPRKVTSASTEAPGAAASATLKELTTADISLVTAIDTAQSPALSVTAADLDLAVGDKIGLNFAGTLTGLVGQLVVFIRPI